MKEQLFHEYFTEWIDVYKKGAVRPITYRKYEMTARRLAEIAPELKVEDISKRSYQSIINTYAENHERQTTLDFHHHLKGAILDAVDEGLLPTDPTRRIVVKGKAPGIKKDKYLSQCELQSLLDNLHLPDALNWDWLILLMAKTGLRFAEALGLTPSDFDFSANMLSVTKTWDYKHNGGFADTKNESSKRTIAIDPCLSAQFSVLVCGLPENEPVFVNGRVYVSTVNSRLKALCNKSNVPVISMHGLRHTHASLLIFAGVSIASIAKRLGHSNTTTTQETYLHIIKELENQDNEKIAGYLGLLSAG